MDHDAGGGTKFSQRYLEFDFAANRWLGTTIDKQVRVESAEDAFAQLRERDPKRVLFAGLEPMLEPIVFTRLGGARYEFNDEPPFPEYLGKKP
jgi:hypothetical protein